MSNKNQTKAMRERERERERERRCDGKLKKNTPPNRINPIVLYKKIQ